LREILGGLLIATAKQEPIDVRQRRGIEVPELSLYGRGVMPGLR
jgi:hypothetical protein